VRSKGWHRALVISSSLNLLAAPEFEPSGPDQTVPVRLWDLTTLKEVGRLPHPDGINCLALSPDGRQLATHANDKKLRLWDLSTRQEMMNYPASEAQYTWSLGVLAFSPDGTRLVVGDSLSSSTRVIDLRAGQDHGVADPNEERIQADGVATLALSPDGRRLAVGYAFSSSLIWLWDLDTGRCVRKLTGHRAFVDGVAFSPDGRTLVSASADQTIRLWDVETGRLLRVLTGHTDLVVALAVLPDGTGVVSGSPDGTVRLWNLQPPNTNAEPVEIPVRFTPFATPVAFLPDNRSFVTLDTNGAAVIRNSRTGAAEECLTALGTSLCALAVSPDGRWVAAGGPAQHLAAWDRLQRSIVTNITAQTGDVWALDFDSRGRVLRVTASLASGRATVRLLDTRDWREVRSWNVEGWVSCRLAWSPDDRLAVLGGAAGTVTWWDAATGRELEVTQGPSANATSVAFSPDSRWLAAGSWSDGRVILWDTATRRASPPSLLAHLLTAGVGGFMLADEAIKIWDFETRSQLLTIPAPSGFINQTIFSPDGNTLAASSGGRLPEFFVFLWHVPSWEEIAAAEREEAADALPPPK
jgi:WD40 repeat protein